MNHFYLFLALSATIFSCKNESQQKSELVDQTISDGITKDVDSTFHFESCYELVEITETDTIATFISIEIQGNEVFGEEAVKMIGSEYNATAIGSFEGLIEDSLITVTYVYTIEGSRQSEEQEFKLLSDKLLMNKGSLEDRNGKLCLVKKGIFNLEIPITSCE